MTRIPFRFMGSVRSAVFWLGGTLLAVLVMSAYYFVTDPPNRPYTAFGPLLVFGFAAIVVRHKQWLEVTPEGTTLVQRRALFTRRVDLRTARRVWLRGVNGTVQFVASRGGGHVDGRRRRVRTAFCPLMIKSMYAEGSQPPEVLRALADGLRDSRAEWAKETAELLRAQAAHLEAGGHVLTSPLRRHVVDLLPVDEVLDGLGPYWH